MNRLRHADSYVGFKVCRAERHDVSLVTAVVVFVVGFLSGTVTRWVAGLAAIVALVLALLGAVVPEIGVVEVVLDRYYLGNELLFISGFLFGVDASRRTGTPTDRD